MWPGQHYFWKVPWITMCNWGKNQCCSRSTITWCWFSSLIQDLELSLCLMPLSSWRVLRSCSPIPISRNLFDPCICSPNTLHTPQFFPKGKFKPHYFFSWCISRALLLLFLTSLPSSVDHSLVGEQRATHCHSVVLDENLALPWNIEPNASTEFRDFRGERPLPQHR